MENGVDPVGHVDAGGQRRDNTCLFDDGDVGRVADQGDGFGTSLLLGHGGDEKIGSIIVGAADEGIDLVDLFFDEKIGIAAVAVDDGGFGQSFGEFAATVPILFDDAERDMLLDEEVGEMECDG